MDELKQKRIETLQDKLEKIGKELFEIEEGGIILDSGRIVPAGGYKYRNKLNEEYNNIYKEIRKLQKEEKICSECGKICENNIYTDMKGEFYDKVFCELCWDKNRKVLESKYLPIRDLCKSRFKELCDANSKRNYLERLWDDGEEEIIKILINEFPSIKQYIDFMNIKFKDLDFIKIVSI
jgi:hypothetical protein